MQCCLTIDISFVLIFCILTQNLKVLQVQVYLRIRWVKRWFEEGQFLLVYVLVDPIILGVPDLSTVLERRRVAESRHLEEIAVSTEYQSVGQYWVSVCRSVLSISLSVSTEYQSVGQYWVSVCRSVLSISLSVSTEYQSVGQYWVSVCRSVLSISLSVSTGYQSVGQYWVSVCRSVL